MDFRKNPETGEVLDLYKIKVEAQRCPDEWARARLWAQVKKIESWPEVGQWKKEEPSDRTVFGDHI